MNSNEGSADTAMWQLRLCRRNRREGERLFIQTPNFGGQLRARTEEWQSQPLAPRGKQGNRETDPKLVPGLSESDRGLDLWQSAQW